MHKSPNKRSFGTIRDCFPEGMPQSLNPAEKRNRDHRENDRKRDNERRIERLTKAGKPAFVIVGKAW